MDLRQELKITQKDLGNEVGLSQSMIAHIESGTKEPKGIYKLRLAKRMGVSVEWLFYEQLHDDFELTTTQGGQVFASTNRRELPAYA